VEVPVKKQLALRVMSAIICVLMVASPGYPQEGSTGTLKGSVVDEFEKVPVRKAFILIHRPGAEDRRIYTDERGRFAAELSPGYYDVFIASVGFDPECRKIEIDGGKATVYKVMLKMSKVANQAD
jgi:hypothetical protein